MCVCVCAHDYLEEVKEPRELEAAARPVNARAHGGAEGPVDAAHALVVGPEEARHPAKIPTWHLSARTRNTSGAKERWR